MSTSLGHPTDRFHLSRSGTSWTWAPTLALLALTVLTTPLTGCGGGSSSETAATSDASAAGTMSALRHKSKCDRRHRKHCEGDSGGGDGGGGGGSSGGGGGGTPSNQPPEITLPASALSMRGWNFEPMSFSATDPEGGAVTLVCSGCPDLTNWGAATSFSFSLTAASPTARTGGDPYQAIVGAAGIYDTRWTATDASGNSSTAGFTWEVVDHIIAGSLNGSFEAAGATTNGAQYWVLQGGASIVANGSPASGVAPAAPDGTRAALLRSNAVLHQAMVVAVGDPLEFMATQTDAGGSQTLGVFVNGVQQGASVTPARGAWSKHTVVLNPTRSGPNSIEIRGLGSAGALVDGARTRHADSGWLDTLTNTLEYPTADDGTVLWDPTTYETALSIGVRATAGSGVALASAGSEPTLGTPAPVDGQQVLLMRGGDAQVNIQNNSGMGSFAIGTTVVFYATQGNAAVDQVLEIRATGSGTLLTDVITVTPPRGSWQRVEIPLSTWVSYRTALRGIELRGTRAGADALIDSVRIQVLAR